MDMDININFACYCISTRIDISKVIDYFGIKKNDKKATYVVLNNDIVNGVLKYSNELKEVYLFEFGYICFTNLKQEEIHILLDFIASIIGPINQELSLKYNEFYNLDKNESIKAQTHLTGELPDANAYITVLPVILAKSTAFQKIEDEVTVLLDRAENFLNGPLRGKGVKSKKGFINIYSKNLRFQNELVNNIGIYDKPYFLRTNIDLSELYTYFSDRYELSERLRIINNKKNELIKIINLYSDMQYKKNSWRLLMIEIVLLALFPLSYFTSTYKEVFNIAKSFIKGVIENF